MALTKVPYEMLNLKAPLAPLQYLTFLDGTNPPIETTDSALNRVRSFAAGQTQTIQASFKVPKSYIAGQQLFARALFYSAGTGTTALLQTTTTLVKVGQVFTTTTNQRTSTNSAITLGTSNFVTEVTFDLTDSSGQINSTAVAANDLIMVSLKRGADATTNDLVFLQDSAEVYV